MGGDYYIEISNSRLAIFLTKVAFLDKNVPIFHNNILATLFLSKAVVGVRWEESSIDSL